ncbi:MAG: hypothetical protein GX790_03740, partial [Syntrophomonadaceae bacterium]|nr:hypothetical protein [Syntrophomonadaceae bacterium]
MRNYISEYKEKLITAKKAAQLVNSGSNLMYAPFLGRPIDFDTELAKRKEELYDVRILSCGGAVSTPVPTPTVDA